MSGSPPVIEVRDLLVIRGGVPVLSVPELTIAEGEVLFLIGPNGAGKTTLLQALSALIKPYRGQILFRGQRIGTDIPLLEYRRRLAMILQEPLLFDTTVFNNVASGLRIRGMKRDRIKPLVIKTMERFEIAHLRNRSARTLSGGEARRTSIARAFATNPEILLLDEPFSALDPIIRENLMEDLEQVLRETGITTIFVTHDRMEAIRIGKRLGVMNGGEILQIDSTDEIMYHPADEFVASLVGVENILQGEVTRRSGGTFITSVFGQDIEAVGDVDPGVHVALCIRPEDVTLSIMPPEDLTSGRNTFRGKIEKITLMGFYKKVHLSCGFPLVSYVTNQSAPALALQEGKEIHSSFKATAIHVIRKSGSGSHP